MEIVHFEIDFASWQKAARSALGRDLPPEQILWRPSSGDQGDLDLFDKLPPSAPLLKLTPLHAETKFRVPRDYLATARLVACHRATTRWDLLYRALWRLTHGEPHLMEIATDPDVISLAEHAKSVRRDVHKMRAFVRFREVIAGGETWFVSWFEPRHLIVKLNASFFVDRFFSMNWSILTPDGCAHWDRQALTFSSGVTPEQAPTEDVTEELWRTYYRNIFNPARVKIGAMKKEMAPYYWRNLPESKIIPELIAGAQHRVGQMAEASVAKQSGPEEFGPAPVPNTDDWEIVREAAKTCRACPLWKNSTCVVFGEGPFKTDVLVVGEQPGDQEDLAGRPFVGPAGKLFDRALAAAGVDRAQVYVTNAVKHFKWEPRGKRRLHQKPNDREMAACRPWLEKEISLLRPKLIVCLGATAAHSVIGAGIKVTEQRGSVLPTEYEIPALVTVHPSSLLRQPDRGRAEDDFIAFVADLKKIKSLLSTQ